MDMMWLNSVDNIQTNTHTSVTVVRRRSRRVELQAAGQLERRKSFWNFNVQGFILIAENENKNKILVFKTWGNLIEEKQNEYCNIRHFRDKLQKLESHINTVNRCCLFGNVK